MKKGVIVYIKADFSNDLERIPISELRRLWFWLMMSSERMNLSTEVDLKGDQTGLWIHNRNHKYDLILEGMESYGVHCWSGDNDLFVDYFALSPTTEALIDQVGTFCYWLAVTPTDLINHSLESRHARAAYDRANRIFDPLLLELCKLNHITPALERDKRRLREFVRSQRTTRPYYPYLQLTLHDKQEVLERIRTNRRNTALNLPLIPIGK